MKSNIMVISAAFILSGLFQACKTNAPAKNYNQAVAPETAQFVADESFSPIVDQEVYVFKNVQTRNKPELVYKSENDIISYLLKDSASFAFLSRDLSPEESKTFKEHNLHPVVAKFAIDAVTLIVNEASTDTTITVAEIKNMFKGKTKTDKSIVFDNPNSSLVRYLKDFTGSGDLKQKNIYSLKSNKEVIEYVSKHPDAIGIIGFSWLNDPDADYAEAVKKVKVVGVKDEGNKDAPDQYFKPSQTSMALKQYPLLRDLYIVNCIASSNGVGAEFEHFLVSDRGQRIILRSGLLPASIPGREIIIHSDKKL